MNKPTRQMLCRVSTHQSRFNQLQGWRCMAIAVRNIAIASQEAYPVSMFERLVFVLSFLTKAIHSPVDRELIDGLTKRLPPLILCAHGWRLNSHLNDQSPPTRPWYI